MALPYSGPCIFPSIKDLLPINNDRTLNLTSFLLVCDEVCLSMYGTGNSDLAGVGVRILPVVWNLAITDWLGISSQVITTYGLQLGLAVLFGPVLFCGFIFWPGSRLVCWLEKHQEVSLWSQIVFALAFSLACVLRQYQWKPVYERPVIVYLVWTNAIGCTLCVTSSFQAIKRRALFAPSLLAIASFSIGAAARPLIPRNSIGRLLDACTDLAEEVGEPWAPYAYPGDRGSVVWSLTSSVPPMVAILILFISWIVARRHRWNPAQQLPRKWAPRVTLSVAVLLSFVLVGYATYLFYCVMRLRWVLKVKTGESTEHAWGIGQVCAPFAWAPLIADMVYGIWGEGDTVNSRSVSSTHSLQTPPNELVAGAAQQMMQTQSIVTT